MADIDVKKLLDPTGPEVQGTVHGTRIAGRVAVTVYWLEIENALRSGLSIAAIYRVLHKAGLVSVTLQAFTRQVKARRKGAGGAGAAAKPAAEAQALPERVGAEEAWAAEALPARPGEAQAALKAPAGPRPAWLREPPPATNRNAVYKPPIPRSES